MKVTKIVRDFVEEKVNEKYPLPVEPVEAIQLERSALGSCVAEALKAASETLTRKLRELGVVYPDGVARMEVTCFNRLNDKDERIYVDPIRPIRDAYLEEKAEVEAKRTKAQKEILVSLELGGTKAELLEMLANLPD
mgnify:FL=1|nr:MAG TPA: hypothetical protein [Caudoviricetes sp.]